VAHGAAGRRAGRGHPSRGVLRGTYAVARCRGVENIFTAWRELGAWVETSKYSATGAPGFEEHLSPPGTPVADWAFDLYLPVMD
jgi:DNA gyrase inhibitor GyrI